MWCLREGSASHRSNDLKKHYRSESIKEPLNLRSFSENREASTSSGGVFELHRSQQKQCPRSTHLLLEEVFSFYEEREKRSMPLLFLPTICKQLNDQRSVEYPERGMSGEQVTVMAYPFQADSVHRNMPQIRHVE
mgnify:FL=1